MWVSIRRTKKGERRRNNYRNPKKKTDTRKYKIVGCSSIDIVETLFLPGLFFLFLFLFLPVFHPISPPLIFGLLNPG